ncbi:MAG: M20 family peptidase [Parvibaculum sp.]|nr:M20 family peptidase [Parvibaculum sp.]
MKRTGLRILAGAGALLALIVIVVITRTAMIDPPPVVLAALPSPLTPEATASAAEHLSTAIRLPTISWQRGMTGAKADASNKAFVDFREFITATYPIFSKTATREIVSDYSLLFTWQGSDPSLEPVLFMSHMDVVPVVPGTEADWKHDPFGGEIVDGVIWGRGAIDCKASLIALLEAANTLMAKGYTPKRTILFAFGHDEEVSGLTGNLKIAEMLKARGVKLAFVSDEGGMLTSGVVGGVENPVALIGIAEKGYMTLQLTTHAAGGHSSMPPTQGETAIGRLINAMDAVGNAPFKSGVDTPTRAMLDAIAPAMPYVNRMVFANMWLFEPIVVATMAKDQRIGAGLHTTIAPTMIKAGIKENVLPPEAEGIINFRLHQRDTIESATAHVRAAINDPEVEIATLEGARNASAVSNLDGEAFHLIRDSINTSFPDALVAPNLTVAATDSRHYLPLTDNVFRFVPLRLNASELAAFHATNERVPVASLTGAVGFYISIMQNIDDPKL